MIGTIARVSRSEGFGSVLRRMRERIGETVRMRTMLARGAFTTPGGAALLNVSAMGPFARLGGLPAQLSARLDEERTLRAVALLYPGVLEVGPIARRAPFFSPATALFDLDFEHAVRYALEATGARTIHLEGTAGIPTGSVLRMMSTGLEVVLGVHDFSLFCARPHLVHEPSRAFCNYEMDIARCDRCLLQTWPSSPNGQTERRSIARHLLTAARAVVFPSRFLRDKHRELFALPDLEGHVIEPALRSGQASPRSHGGPPRIAYAGSLKRHKGAQLLPDIIAAFANGEVDWHVFGGGDEDLLRTARGLPGTTVHGYHRAGTLPSLLATHGIDLGLLLSTSPETYCFVLSELWSAGVPAVGFAHGAIAERIGRAGGGWLSPVEEGAGGIVRIVRQWLDGNLTTVIPQLTTTPRHAAAASIALYRSLGLIA